MTEQERGHSFLIIPWKVERLFMSAWYGETLVLIQIHASVHV